MCGDFWFGKFGGEMFLLWGLQKTRENSVSKNAEDRSVQSISGSKWNKGWKESILVLLDPTLVQKRAPKKRLPNVINYIYIVYVCIYVYMCVDQTRLH